MMAFSVGRTSVTFRGEYLLRMSFDFHQFVCKSDEVIVQYKMEVGRQIYANKFRKMQLHACWGTWACQL
jgi:hypothetical protein